MGFVLREFLPEAVVDRLRELRRKLRRARYHLRRLQGTVAVQVPDLVEALRALGVRRGDDMLVHSSLRGLGVVQGGADAVARGLLETVGESGTVLVPAYPFTGTMLEHLRRGGIALDSRTTPSTMGRVSEVLRCRADSHRSLHPTHSIAAVGPRAEWYCADHAGSVTPCGPGSPFARLIEREGWIIALGSPIGKITSYHRIEDTVASFPVDVYLHQEFDARVIDANGTEHVAHVKCHDPVLSRRRIDNNRVVEAAFEGLLSELGVLDRVGLGVGRVWAMRADRLQSALLALLGKGITIYDVSRVAGA